MADSDEPKKSNTLAWQMKVEPGNEQNAHSQEQKQDDSHEQNQEQEHEQDKEQEPSAFTEDIQPDSTIAQAKKFLEHDTVRRGNAEQKTSFLKSKGLHEKEIESLLDASSYAEANKTSVDVGPELQELDPNRSTKANPSALQQLTQPQPPIITYPEFLITPSSPSPLMTKGRLLTTLYLFSSLAAILYGTKTYLVQPMLASLTASRLSLADTASSNLAKLITKLEGMVSEMPAETQTILPRHGRDEVDSDEDPTEMFHRDIGVQTSSPSRSRAGSLPLNQVTALADQSSRLHTLKSALQGLVDDSESESHDITELEGTVAVLRQYLDGIMYAVPTSGYGGMLGYGGTGGYTNSDDANDEISKLKASIRGVKGVLLSARTFPGGVQATGR